jgi:hypothetical protein
MKFSYAACAPFLGAHPAQLTSPSPARRTDAAQDLGFAKSLFGKVGDYHEIAYVRRGPSTLGFAIIWN